MNLGPCHSDYGLQMPRDVKIQGIRGRDLVAVLVIGPRRHSQDQLRIHVSPLATVWDRTPNQVGA